MNFRDFGIFIVDTIMSHLMSRDYIMITQKTNNGPKVIIEPCYFLLEAVGLQLLI